LNHIHAITTSNLRYLLPLLAAAALAFAALAADATAGSGGLNAGERTTTSGGGGDKYDRIWSRVGKKQKRWARKTAECESGKDPKAIGGGGKYRGAFQFMKATWRSSPKSPGGDPIRYRYRVQAVVAVKLKKRDGRGHWPTCG
jgi:hypothetical protein